MESLAEREVDEDVSATRVPLAQAESTEPSRAMTQDERSRATEARQLEAFQSRFRALKEAKDADGLLGLFNDLQKAGDVGDLAKLATDVVEAAAGIGSVEAMLAAGKRAEDGLGRRADPYLALAYFEQAGAAGDSRGYLSAAKLLIEGRYLPADVEDAEAYLARAIEMGNAEALSVLGSMLLDDPERKAQGMDYLVKAAELGEPSALRKLSRLYGGGDGSFAGQDLSLSTELLRAAAEAGSERARISLATLALGGNADAGYSAAEAEGILKAAAGVGDGEAAFTLAKHYSKDMRSNQPDFREVDRLAHVAFDGGQSGAAYMLASHSYYLKRSEEEAVDWLQKGMRAGDFRTGYAYLLVEKEGYSFKEAMKAAARATVEDYTNLSLETADNRPGSGDFSPPVALAMEMPQFPVSLRDMNVAGEVKVSFLVDESGMPLDPKVLESTHPQLERSVLAAVSAWRFSPARKKGEALPINMVVPIKFRSKE